MTVSVLAHLLYSFWLGDVTISEMITLLDGRILDLRCKNNGGAIAMAGVAIALGTMFTLGVLAARAEPALNVLAQVKTCKCSSPAVRLYQSGDCASGPLHFRTVFRKIRPEPANAWQIVEKLTKGTFTKAMLILAVCIGVGTGMTVGATVLPMPLVAPMHLAAGDKEDR